MASTSKKQLGGTGGRKRYTRSEHARAMATIRLQTMPRTSSYTNQQRPSYLLDLPAEIRIMIWRHVMSDESGAFVLYFQQPNGTPGLRRYPRRRHTQHQLGPLALVLTCLQIRNETNGLRFREPRFFLKQSRLPVTTISDSSVFASLRHLRVEWSFFKDDEFKPEGLRHMVNLIELEVDTTAVIFELGAAWLRMKLPRLQKITIHHLRLFEQFRNWAGDNVSVAKFKPGCHRQCAHYARRPLNFDEFRHLIYWEGSLFVFYDHIIKLRQLVQDIRPESGIVVHPELCTQRVLPVATSS